MRDCLMTTPTYRIGKHEWRAVVYTSKSGNFTDYEWRDPDWHIDPAFAWRSMTRWPRYNHNDGMYAGCPKSLRSKIWEQHKHSIREHLRRSGAF